MPCRCRPDMRDMRDMRAVQRFQPSSRPSSPAAVSTPFKCQPAMLSSSLLPSITRSPVRPSSSAATTKPFGPAISVRPSFRTAAFNPVIHSPVPPPTFVESPRHVERSVFRERLDHWGSTACSEPSLSPPACGIWSLLGLDPFHSAVAPAQSRPIDRLRQRPEIRTRSTTVPGTPFSHAVANAVAIRRCVPLPSRDSSRRVAQNRPSSSTAMSTAFSEQSAMPSSTPCRYRQEIQAVTIEALLEQLTGVPARQR
ncbi:hypothetical protein QBC39DRAFT_33672 [Podospora conica]|nr:hypothetical protein QBC39DRAFT_33672 [Schizothecium conicum]